MSGLANDVLTQAAIGFARVSGCLLMLPGLSSVRVPQQVRMIFALVLSIAILPFITAHIGQMEVRSGWPLVRILFTETVTGAFLGIGARYYMLAVSFMMNAASAAGGISAQLAPSVMENDVEPALAALVSSATLATLFALDFHLGAIRALVNSFTLMPVGQSLDIAAISENLVTYLSDCFLAVFSLASPFLAYALLANMLVAFVNKLIPVLPLYFVAGPAVLLGALLLIYVLMPSIISLAAQGYFEMPR